MSSVIYDSFRALHVKKDGTYTDKKSERIDVEVQEIAAEMGQSHPDTPVDMNKIYLDVLGGGLDKKQRLLGTDSLASTLKTGISGESSTSAVSDIDKEQYATRLGDVASSGARKNISIRGTSQSCNGDYHVVARAIK
ncbi:uncharacterized protein LOC131024605 [Salvia miltiorrhiza]|uniref:uncharacterized protein LOC131024605 n=1 Tax=Salvia miltiorrhiza TaxID=226208 RepID=UPI0025AB7730|nr:uncharacterized protein LOC131024605 [Salvia miltiorrhiza]